MEEVKVIDNGGEICFGIYFYDKKGNRCEVNVYSDTIQEALGAFFIENPSISYDDVIDHMEIA